LHVIHGEADPLVPVAGRARPGSARIAGAVADFIPGMGHDLPLQLLPRFADVVGGSCRR
jgi:pimeloyl-ACP methyl ester carboxylesterase